ncbi:MAG: hypothetical protein Q8J68_14815 [Methanolobus sp.]|uniref:hypothetical protein n=1 Tax=Methanolobus sp. TaxID=1874737 RepID=UPI0027302B47|nr:hypothetical protein [Methanolobus sp.]MDP2218547.1 hypothetical protein [Methanolobus sp.]
MDDDLNIDGSQKDGDDGRPAWMGQLSDDLKSNEVLTQFKTISDLGKGHLDLTEKSKSYIKPLGEKSTPEEVAEFRKAIGAPESPDGYKIERPDKFPEGFVYDEVLEKEFRELAFAEHIPPKQVASLYNFYLNRELKLHDEVSEFVKENRNKAVNTLKDIWKGDAYKENTEKAIRTFHKFLETSSPPETLGGAEGVKDWVEKNGFGDDPVMIWTFSKLFDLIGDDKFIKGAPAGGTGDVLDQMFPSMK